MYFLNLGVKGLMEECMRLEESNECISQSPRSFLLWTTANRERQGAVANQTTKSEENLEGAVKQTGKMQEITVIERETGLLLTRHRQFASGTSFVPHIQIESVENSC